MNLLSVYLNFKNIDKLYYWYCMIVDTTQIVKSRAVNNCGTNQAILYKVILNILYMLDIMLRQDKYF